MFSYFFYHLYQLSAIQQWLPPYFIAFSFVHYSSSPLVPPHLPKPYLLFQKPLVLPVAKDSSTLQYLTTFSQGTPLVPIKLIIDLSGQYIWVDCKKDYIFSTYKSACCNSAQCSLSNSKAYVICYSPKPTSYNNICHLSP